MTDDDLDRPEPRPEPPPAEAVTALLREARSLSRRADKLGATAAAAVDDPETQQLAAEACTSMELGRWVHTVRLQATLREVTPAVLRVVDVPASCTLS